jgi:hypothetical protein
MEATRRHLRGPAGRRGRLSTWVGFILVLIAALSAHGADGVKLLEGGWTRVRPSAVWCGAKNSSVTIEAHIVGHDDIRSVHVVGPNESFQLYDDGTHGDGAAGDSVFTAEGVRPYCSTRYSLRYGNAVGTWYGTLEVTLTSGDRLVDDKDVRIGLVHPRYANAFRFETYGDGLSATVFAFFVEDIDRTVFDGYPLSSTEPDVAAREAVRKLYAAFPDRFDFVLVMPKMPIFTASDVREEASLSLRVSNDVLYIGLPVFNHGAEYGSGGFLKGVIYHSFGSLDLVDLEMAGLWGADIGAPLGLATEIEEGRYLWNPLSDVDGQLSAFYVSETGLAGRFAESNEGTWRFVTTIGNLRYTSLELYTMGLLPADAVPPVHLLVDPDLTDPQHVTAGSVSTFTIEDLTAAQGGVRTCLAGAAPIEYSVAFVVVGDEPFTSAEYAYFSLLAYELTTKAAPAPTEYYAPFYWATGGRATLRVLLPVTIAIPAGM